MSEMHTKYVRRFVCFGGLRFPFAFFFPVGVFLLFHSGYVVLDIDLSGVRVLGRGA